MTDQPDRKTALNQPEVNGQALPTLADNVTVPDSSGYISSLSSRHPARGRVLFLKEIEPTNSWILLAAVGVMVVGIWFKWDWVGFSGAVVALLLSLQLIVPALKKWLSHLKPSQRRLGIAFIVFILALAGLFKYVGIYDRIGAWLKTFEYDEFGSWAEWVGASGQIMIAILAVYVAWAQYVISKDLTIQQNRITQQQTIDSYFQGISDLALDEEGLLEDWPQERAIAEGRTASIISSVDASGKAKILRFLSQSKLLSPIQRDNYLGRPILDGVGGYAEDRVAGIRVVQLGVMLAGADISGQDLRWTDLAEANLVRTDLSFCDLVKANLSRTILYEGSLKGADIKGVRFFYGTLENASPRSRTITPNYETGAHTGTVVENVDFTEVRNMNEEQRCYCCRWGGENTRTTIPGGCEGIPNQLGR